MQATKECSNCGADNDPILTNCLYCKSPLPDIDIDSISNEDLIMNAGEWVGKVGQAFEHITENYNEWTGKGKIVISANQLEGMAQKYLSLLQVRCMDNPRLQMAYTDLKTEFDNKRKGLAYKIGGGDKKKGTVIIVGLIIMLLILLIPIII
ncbi:MAG: hypothetical protein RIG77_17365 [Cyclobacteriaceae bacterium]